MFGGSGSFDSKLKAMKCNLLAKIFIHKFEFNLNIISVFFSISNYLDLDFVLKKFRIRIWFWIKDNMGLDRISIFKC